MYKETEIMVYIWQDYKDPNLREEPEYKRYHFVIEIDSTVLFQHDTDDWNMIEVLVKSLKIKNFTEELKRFIKD